MLVQRCHEPSNWIFATVVWYILILCSFSDAAAGSLRVWLFIYQDQGWTSPDLVCLGATLLLTLLHLILPGRFITINITLHYFPGHYISTYITAWALHYITYITTLLVCPSTTLLTAAWRWLLRITHNWGRGKPPTNMRHFGTWNKYEVSVH